MDLYQKLTIVNCVTSTVTLGIVSMALLPHLKNGFVVVRDAVLWAALVLLLFGLGWSAFQQLDATDSRPAAAETSRVISVDDQYFRGRPDI